MATKTTRHSAFIRAGQAAKLAHWYGSHQHVGDGISSDPEHPSIPAGTLRTPQYRKMGQKEKR